VSNRHNFSSVNVGLDSRPTVAINKLTSSSLLAKVTKWSVFFVGEKQ